jgi:hypothetical protein
LLRKDTAWIWQEPQERAFLNIKNALVSPTVLAHYNPDHSTIIAADASAAGISAVLLQVQEDGERRPICYASRSLSDTEKRYGVIEKEAFAITWACERFAQYVTGIKFVVETDHKPLTTLFNTTELSNTQAYIQRFRMRLNQLVTYVPGKLWQADCSNIQ